MYLATKFTLQNSLVKCGVIDGDGKGACRIYLNWRFTALLNFLWTRDCVVLIRNRERERCKDSAVLLEALSRKGDVVIYQSTTDLRTPKLGHPNPKRFFKWLQYSTF